MDNREVWIVEVELPPRRAVLLQGLLYGQDGLAVIRCQDPEHRRQQLWTTPAQRRELYAWLDELPAELELKVTGERLWQQEAA